MLKRTLRLKKELMAGIFRSGRRMVGGSWIVVYRPNQQSGTRFGFVAGAKLFPTAVLRHRAKRVAREIIRSLSSSAAPGYDIIIMYRLRPERWDFQALSASLEDLLTRSRLISRR